MKTGYRPIVMLLAMALLLGLPLKFTAFSHAAAEEEYEIGFVYPTLNNPFFVDQSRGADQAAAEFGAKVTHVSGDNDVNKQTKQMEDFIARGVDAIVVQAADTAGIIGAIKEANEAGIPVFTTGEVIVGADVVTAVHFDNLESGFMGGAWIASQLPEGGKVVELLGILGTETGRQKSEGFRQGLDSAGAVFEIVAAQPANYDRNEALTVMENILQAQPEIDVVYASNDEMALGALQAIEEAGRQDEIIVVGNDGTDDALTAIREGRLAASIATPAYIQGYIAIQTAIKYLDGVSVPPEIRERSTPITIDNVDDSERILRGVAPEDRYWEHLYNR